MKKVTLSFAAEILRRFALKHMPKDIINQQVVEANCNARRDMINFRFGLNGSDDISVNVDLSVDQPVNSGVRINWSSSTYSLSHAMSLVSLYRDVVEFAAKLEFLMSQLDISTDSKADNGSDRLCRKPRTAVKLLLRSVSISPVKTPTS